MTIEKDLRLTAADGTQIAATFFEPPVTAQGQMLIAGAMGVPRQYYRHFARFCANQGIRCLTLDYRGTGESHRPPYWRKKADILHWAQLDLPAAKNALSEKAPDLPITYLGHSLGGQIMGLMPCAGEFEQAIFVASGFGYWRLFPRRLWPRMWLAWFLLVPLTVALLQQVPAWVLGGGTPLPGRAARRWRHWCLNPHYVVDDQGQPLRPFYSAVRSVRFFSMADDHDLAPLEATKALATLYPEKRTHIVVQRPEAYGLPAIGHFGCFKPQIGMNLWPTWLAAVPRRGASGAQKSKEFQQETSAKQ